MAEVPRQKPSVTEFPVNGTEPVDLLREALGGKARLFVLRLEADVTAVLTHRGSRLPLPHLEGYHRLLAHKAAELCGFVHTIEHSVIPRTLVLVHPGGTAGPDALRDLVADATAAPEAPAVAPLGTVVAGDVPAGDAPVRVVMMRRGGNSATIAAPPITATTAGASVPATQAEREQAEQDAREARYMEARARIFSDDRDAATADGAQEKELTALLAGLALPNPPPGSTALIAAQQTSADAPSDDYAAYVADSSAPEVEDYRRWAPPPRAPAAAAGSRPVPQQLPPFDPSYGPQQTQPWRHPSDWQAAALAGSWRHPRDWQAAGLGFQAAFAAHQHHQNDYQHQQYDYQQQYEFPQQYHHQHQQPLQHRSQHHQHFEQMGGTYLLPAQHQQQAQQQQQQQQHPHPHPHQPVYVDMRLAGGLYAPHVPTPSFWVPPAVHTRPQYASHAQSAPPFGLAPEMTSYNSHGSRPTTHNAYTTANALYNP